MRRVVTDDRIGEFVAARAKCTFQPGMDVAFGVVDDSREAGSPGWIRGGVIFTNYSQSAIWIHVAGADEAWITREMLWKTFHYPFAFLGCAVLYGIVEEANAHALEFDLRLGFRVHCALPSVFASGAGLVVSMRREDCRWLRLVPPEMMEDSTHGWEGRQGTAAA